MSSETPTQPVSSFDHFVTQWMSTVISSCGRALELVPRPRQRLVDLADERQAPLGDVDVRRRPSGEDRESIGQVLAGWHATGRGVLSAPAQKAPRDTVHAGTMPDAGRVALDRMKAANLALRFLVEVAALAALAYWGAHTGSGAVKVVLAIAAPLAGAVVWGLFAAPKAARRLPRAPRVAVEAAVFAAAAAGLAVTGQGVLAAVFVVVAVVNGALVYAWDG